MISKLHIKNIVEKALAEDIGSGDITTDFLIDPDAVGTGVIYAKEFLILAGIEIVKEVFWTLDPKIEIDVHFQDGQEVENAQTIMNLAGNQSNLLKGERTALNFLQRLSGIATFTHSNLKEIKGTTAKLVDTRKTTPGWRVLEKHAVRMGGAHNHRMGLYDGVLIKDNHIAACGGITKAVETIRKQISHFIKIEVEVTNFEELEEAIAAKVDIIMLDNMGVEEIGQALNIIHKQALVEVSGGIKQHSLREIASLGVDIISMGALTHSARAVDISMSIHA